MFRHVREQWSCKRCAYLPLAGEVAVTRRDTEDEGVELGELVGLDYGIIRLRGGVHLGEDFLGEGLSDPGEKHIAQSRGVDRGALFLLTGRWSQNHQPARYQSSRLRPL